MSHHARLWAILWCITCIPAACRSRGERLPATNLNNLEIEMVDITGTFEAQQEYQYDLTGCGENIKFIELDAADVLHYEAENVESGASCRLEVLDERRQGEPETEWSSGRPGVIFWTKNLVVIDRGNRGQLRGVAMLSPGAVGKDSFDNENFKAVVPVDFEGKNPGDLGLDKATASLTCQTAVGDVGLYVPKSEKDGEFLFILTPPFSDQKIICTRITVSIDGVQRFAGDLGIGATFKAQPGGEAILSPEPVRLTEIKAETASGVEIILKEGKCPSGQVFDPQADKCK